MAMTTATTEGGRGPGRRSLRRRITGDVRTRLIASSVVLLAFAAGASVLLVRQVLLLRLDDRVEADLVQEEQEFRRLAGGTDPETGRPFGTDINRIFDVYLDRNVPGAPEQLITVPRRGEIRLRSTERAEQPLDPELYQSWRRLDAPERGSTETEAGPVEYLAVPIERGGRTLGTFAVAYFVAGEREEVDEAVRIVAAVAAGVLLVGTALAFITAGRVLAPLAELRDAARSVSGTEMARRIEVHGDDELAELARTFNGMLDRLEGAFGSQRQFIRDASHELRTPIAVVRGHLELLAEGGLDDEERHETIELLTGELDRMTRFVTDMLLLAKAEQPDFLEPETIDLEALAEELLAKATALGDRDWQLDRSTRRTIVADRQRLTQAMMNLIDNAVINSQPGTRIAIGSELAGTEARLWVADDGPGIDFDDHRRVLEPFTRGSEGRRRYEGSGLGLPIVRAIAEAHGGRIEIDSAPGAGTTVTLVLPIEGPAEAEPPRRPA